MKQILLTSLAAVGCLVQGRTITEDLVPSVRSQGSCGSQVCTTPQCILESNRILQNANMDVDPCDDFYEYVCGGFIKKTRIPDEKSSISQFSVISDELIEQLRTLLEEEPSEEDVKLYSEQDSKVFKMARDQYKACMDLDALEVKGLEPLLSLLRDLGGWPVIEGDGWKESEFDWRELTYKFRERGYSVDMLVDFSIGSDLKDSENRIIYLDQPGLGLSKEFLDEGMDNDYVKKYFEYMQNIAEMLGANSERAKKELGEVLKFEMELAKASLPREERRDATKLYHDMKLKEVVEKTSDLGVDWVEHINKILTTKVAQVDGDERIVVSTPGYLKNLTKILEKTDNRVLANYMLWRATKGSIGMLNKKAREIAEDYSKKVSGKKETPPRWKTCVGSASGSFSAAMGKLYVQKHFKAEAKEAMLDMVAGIRAEFGKIIDKIDWMDKETKVAAHQKLSTIKEYIGYPEEILDNAKLEDMYDGIEVKPDDLFGNGISMSIWGTNYHWSKLREKVDKTDWKRHAAPAVVNAFYSPIENSIQFPAGILQGTFFNNDRPKYMNYGGIGWVIGHEITHGFDDQGRQFDDEGNLKEWWDKKTLSNYKKKTQCIIDQYGNFTHPQIDINLNGINTQGENIADNGGIKEAYRAYQNWVKANGEEPQLPGINANANQLFWISAASTWCNKATDKSLEQRIKLGAHSPGRFRVIGTLSNQPEFASDFNCARGQNMNPQDRCSVW